MRLAFCFKTQTPKKEKGMGKKVNQNREMTPPAQQMPNAYGRERSHWVRQTLSKAMSRDWSTPSLPSAKPESAMAQRDAGIAGLPHLCVSLRIHGQNNSSPLPIFPSKTLAGELNEADWDLILFSVRNLHSKSKHFQKNISVTCFNDK